MVSSLRMGAVRAMEASKSGRRGRATMLSVNFIERELRIERELGIRGNTLGGISEAWGVAHRWFYRLLLQGIVLNGALKKERSSISCIIQRQRKRKGTQDRAVLYPELTVA